jgi:hypothetical protein
MSLLIAQVIQEFLRGYRVRRRFTPSRTLLLRGGGLGGG